MMTEITKETKNDQKVTKKSTKTPVPFLAKTKKKQKKKTETDKEEFYVIILISMTSSM